MTADGVRYRVGGLGSVDLETIAESIPHIAWVADPCGATEYFNRLGTVYTGLPRQANYGWGWLALIHPDDVDRARRGWERATLTETPFEMSYRIRRVDGEFRWHALRALPVRGPDGDVLKWLGTADPLDHPPNPNEDPERIERRITSLRGLLETVELVASEPGGGGPEPLTAEASGSTATLDRPATVASSAPLSQDHEALRTEISLLGTFAMTVRGEDVSALSVGSRRLLVFLALQDRIVTRAATAGTLWPDASDHRAGDSLRSALSRLRGPTRGVIRVVPGGLSLAETVRIDLRDARTWARRLLESGASQSDSDLSPAAISTFSLELLPGWYDDWVVAEAEDWRQLRVNALEALARHLTSRDELALATGAARAAIRAEPLRESAHAGLIRVHLAEGNQSEALRAFDRYRALLFRDLGLEPTRLLSNLVAGLRKQGRPGTARTDGPHVIYAKER